MVQSQGHNRKQRHTYSTTNFKFTTLFETCRVKAKNKAKFTLYKIWGEINFNTYKKRCHNNQHKQFNLSDINTRLSGTGIDIKGVLNDKLRPREKCFKTV